MLVRLFAAILLAVVGAAFLAAEQPQNGPDQTNPPVNKQHLEKAKKTVAQMFSKSFEQATNPAKKRALVRELLDNVPRIKDDVEVRYTLLVEAREQAIVAGQVDLSLEAVDLMTKYFRHDSIELKTAALDRLSKTVRDATSQRQIATAALALSKTALADNRFDDANRLAMLALISARKSKSTQLINQSNSTLLEIMAAKKRAKK